MVVNEFSEVSDADLGIVRASDVKLVYRRHPRVVTKRDEMFLEVFPGRSYRVPDDPHRFMGLMSHLAMKTWASGALISDAIERVAQAKGWLIHPF